MRKILGKKAGHQYAALGGVCRIEPQGGYFSRRMSGRMKWRSRQTPSRFQMRAAEGSSHARPIPTSRPPRLQQLYRAPSLARHRQGVWVPLKRRLKLAMAIVPELSPVRQQ